MQSLSQPISRILPTHLPAPLTLPLQILQYYSFTKDATIQPFPRTDPRCQIDLEYKLCANALALYKFTGNRSLFFGGDTPPCSTTS